MRERAALCCPRRAERAVIRREKNRVVAHLDVIGPYDVVWLKVGGVRAMWVLRVKRIEKDPGVRMIASRMDDVVVQTLHLGMEASSSGCGRSDEAEKSTILGLIHHLDRNDDGVIAHSRLVRNCEGAI